MGENFSPGWLTFLKIMACPRNTSSIFVRIWRFYADGFRQMTVGRLLWALILIKLALLFIVFKLFFFPDRLARDYDNDADRARAVRHELTQPRP